MAKLQRIRRGNFDGILQGSVSARLEDSSDFSMGDVRCSVRVFERYSVLGGNRLSLSVTLFGKDGDVHLSASSSAVAKESGRSPCALRNTLRSTRLSPMTVMR